MTDLPDPLIPAGTDIVGLDCFMLNVERLMASELWALSSGEEFKAAIGLWCRAWKQEPPGSLPNDDKILAAFSGAGPRWKRVKEMALRGFVECSDGRLYHKVLCDDVMRGAKKKTERNERTKAATEARKRKRNEQRDDERDGQRDVDVTTSHRRDGTGHRREEEESPSLRSGVPPDGSNLPAKRDPPRRKPPSTSLPENFPGQEEKAKAIDYWRKNGRSDINLERQAELFRAHHQRSASRFVDWGAAWRTWYVRAVDFSKPGAAPSGGNDDIFSHYGT